MPKPPKANQPYFEEAVEEITRITLHLFDHLEVHGPPRSREHEGEKARERGKKRDAQLRARLLAQG